MSFANVNVGTGPSTGNGDSLRTAFQKINQNFANIAESRFDITVNAPVQSVAGRTGDVILTVNDIPGAATNGYVDSSVEYAISTAREYTDYRVDLTVNNLVNAAPGALDTLKELADALNNDAEFASNIAGRISSLETQIQSLELGDSTDLNLEISARISGDANLQQQINTVVSDLAANLIVISDRDVALQSNIADEESARISGDENLESLINTEIADRVSSIQNLQNDLDTESQTRAADDLSLQSNISAEANARIVADSALEANVSLINQTLNNLATVATTGSYNDLVDKPAGFDPTGLATETYVDSAIAAIPPTDLSGLATETYVDSAIAAIPPTDLSGLATETYVDTAVANLVGVAPSTLDTLNELATALGDDPNFVTTVTNLVGNVQSNVDSVSTSLQSEITRATAADSAIEANVALKANIADLATVSTSGDYNDLLNKPTIPTVPANVSAFVNDSGYITSVTWSDVDNKPSFANVATSGSYNDLTDTPTIPTVPVNVSAFTNDAGYITGIDFANVSAKPTTISGYGITDAFDGQYSSLSGAPVLATVATSGDYNDLINRPSSDTGNFTFSSNTLGVSDTDGGITINANGNGEIFLSDNVGIKNSNPGYALHVGVQTDASVSTPETIGIGISFGDITGTIGGEAALLWDWSDGAGGGSNPDSLHARFGIFKNGSFTQPWLTFDRNAPAGALEVNDTGDLTVYGNIIVNGSQITAANIATWNSGGGGGVNTGDVTFDGVKVIGAGTASGDGNGYATLELVPDNNLYGNDQYLVIDPTSPGHIHIRSGGAQDASNAQLFLGGENTHVRIIDGDNAIRMSHQQSSQLSSVTLTAGVDYSTAEWIDDGGNYSIVFNDVQQSTLDAIWGLSGSLNTFEIYDGVSYTTIAGYYGSSTPGVGQTASLSVGQAPATTPTTVVSVTLNSIGITASYVEVSGTDVRIEAQDDVRIFSRDTFLLANYSTSDPVVISTDYNGTDHRWEFRNDGVLEIPSNGDIIRGGVSVIPNLATVATSGSYNDLNDKPNSITSFNIVDGTSGQVLTTDGAGNFSFSTVSGGGGTSLPADASGYLNNDGAGTLTWVPGNPSGAGMLPYNDVVVFSNTTTGDWTEYTLSGTMDAFYDWNNTYTTITLTSQTAYGKEITPNTKILWINDSKINSNNYLVIEFPSNPAVGDVFTRPMVSITETVNAGSFVVGQTYTILEVGTTNWTSIGAQYGGIGQSFVATGAGSGTGTATTTVGAQKVIFKPQPGTRAQTMNMGSTGPIVFGQGGTYDFMYVDLGGQNANNPITWVYAGVIGGIPTWYQFYF